MAALKEKVLKLIKTWRKDEVSSALTRVNRRRKLLGQFRQRLVLIRVLLYLVGFGWLLLLPSTLLGRGIFIDENALQPGQVVTYWDWSDVLASDKYLEDIEKLRERNATSIERAQYFTTEFAKLGLKTELQQYSFDLPSISLSGANAIALSSSPRSSGAEAMVISSPWISRIGDGTVNVRGVAITLALGRFLKKHAVWAKDLIFVISDGEMHGMHAFLSAYHGSEQKGLKVSKLNITSGSIWTALNLDYPGHSFAELGVFHEGLNGRLPNQDLINSFTLISGWVAGVSVTLYDYPERSSPWTELRSVLPENIRNDHAVVDYVRRARNILRHGSFQAMGKASGAHGLFHQYRIDAFTVFAIPDTGPHGFHSLGKIIESTLRTANNLLERLHASFFFYILTTPRTFLKVGHFLPPVIIVSIAVMIGALESWVQAGWIQEQHVTSTSSVDVSQATAAASEKKTEATAIVNKETVKWRTRPRTIDYALGAMLTTHVGGGLMWLASGIPTRVPVISVIGLALVLVVSGTAVSSPPDQRSHWRTLKALMLSLTSTVLSITSLLNFSLSVTMAILTFPLTFTSEWNYWPAICFAVDIGSRWLKGTDAQLQWEMFGVWTVPFYYLILVPIMLQGAIICALDDV